VNIEALNELAQPAKKQLREDVDGIALRPPYLLGPHELVALHIKERVLLFYEPIEARPFCLVYIPPEMRYPAEGLLSCPGLEGRLNMEMLRDFRAVIWLFLRLGRFEEYFYVPPTTVG
jgi:hypothetical protein